MVGKSFDDGVVVEWDDLAGAYVGYCGWCFSPDWDGENYVGYEQWYGSEEDVRLDVLDHLKEVHGGKTI